MSEDRSFIDRRTLANTAKQVPRRLWTFPQRLLMRGSLRTGSRAGNGRLDMLSALRAIEAHRGIKGCGSNALHLPRCRRPAGERAGSGVEICIAIRVRCPRTGASDQWS